LPLRAWTRAVEGAAVFFVFSLTLIERRKLWQLTGD
jgi:hypothetical protein